MVTWTDKSGVRHRVAMGRPANKTRSRNPVTWITACEGLRTCPREHRMDVNPTCIDCILEED